MKSFIRANKGFILFMLLFGVFRTAVADWNPIPTGSMRPNLLEGDVVFVNRLAYDLKVPLSDVVLARLGEPERGDIVTFKSPTDGTRLIKRILALPGDVVEMRDERLVINGREAGYDLMVAVPDEEVGSSGRKTTALQLRETTGATQRPILVMPQIRAARNFGPVTVPEGQFMMLGDNRDNSADSRFIGFVPRALLVGRAERILVSADIKGNWMPRGSRFLKPLE
ncbi:MAG: signal peptidase I [Telluria sp.]